MARRSVKASTTRRALADAGRNHWIVLMKDDRIRYRPAECRRSPQTVDERSSHLDA
jgi:hypothetical protein